MKISEIITDKYKLRIPPTVYYDLLADVVEAEKEQEPVLHAKWEKFCNKDGILRYLECSNCGQVSNQILLTYKYCPNCGARMDKEDEE